MNIVKFYRRDGDRIKVARIPFSGHARFRSDPTRFLAYVEEHMPSGWTRRRPREFRPHWHPAQQPGYRQPTEQQKRLKRREVRLARRLLERSEQR